MLASDIPTSGDSHRGVAVEAPLPVDFGIRLAFTLASSSQEEAGRRLDDDRPYFYAGRRFQEALALMLETGSSKENVTGTRLSTVSDKSLHIFKHL